MVSNAPCEWPLANVSDCPAIAASGDPLMVKAAAVSYLWNWTGKVFGLCTVAVRPCRQGCNPNTTYRGLAGSGSVMPTVGGLWEPALVAGEWKNLLCGSCTSVCSCDAVQSVVLPGPVHAVTEVEVDGEVLDAGAYRVDDRSALVRDDGGQWPACQDMSLRAGEPGTWSVVYQWGIPVPAGGQVAAAVLACEMSKALSNDASCGLPQRMQTVVREGLTIDVLDPFEGLDGGKTGLWLVDSWVESIRKPQQRSSVYVPGGRPSVRTTTFRGESL